MNGDLCDLHRLTSIAINAINMANPAYLFVFFAKQSETFSIRTHAAWIYGWLKDGFVCHIVIVFIIVCADRVFCIDYDFTKFENFLLDFFWFARLPTSGLLFQVFDVSLFLSEMFLYVLSSSEKKRFKFN